ncbi:hypothetical protein ANTPLA_LOCUS4297 [Anthophora plagiata]
MRRDAPSLPAYKTEAPLTFFCGARSAVLSSTDINIEYFASAVATDRVSFTVLYLRACVSVENDSALRTLRFHIIAHFSKF